jgi:hypothetical protein
MHALLLLMALAGSTPNFNINTICAGARDAGLTGDAAGAFKQCVIEETKARDEVRGMWARTAAAKRSDCIYPGPVTESYVELLTCLQLASGQGFGLPESSTGKLK